MTGLHLPAEALGGTVGLHLQYEALGGMTPGSSAVPWPTLTLRPHAPHTTSPGHDAEPQRQPGWAERL